MVLEAIKNSSVTLQQGSSTGKDVKAPEKKISESPKAVEVSTPLKTEDIQIKEQEQGNAKENILTGNTVDKKESVELPKGNEAMRKAVEQINKNVKNSEAIFGIHDGTNRVTIKIVDRDTKKVLKEFPPEKTLDMIAKVWEMAGLMVDEKM
ncbi:MAG: flagellar protein FlaG [Roseburia sp.]|nr:flagellar protein FlaG [Roseburia sp.]